MACHTPPLKRNKGECYCQASVPVQMVARQHITVVPLLCDHERMQSWKAVEQWMGTGEYVVMQTSYRSDNSTFICTFPQLAQLSHLN